MDKKFFYNLMEEYRNGNLSAELTMKFEEDLKSSPDCQEDYETFLETVNSLKQIPTVETPANLRARINSKLSQAKKSIFDIFFGLGHNPYYAGITVGATLLFLFVISANVVDINKPNQNVPNQEIYAQSAGLPNNFASQFKSMDR